jgi:2'-hydroxyisoflavone reductase
LTMGHMLDQIKKTTSSDARFTWVDDKFLSSEKIIDDIPIWTSPHGPEIGYSTMNINKAISKGLTFRPLSDTTKATLDWFRKQPVDRQLRMRAGLKPAREAEVLAAWHASRK